MILLVGLLALLCHSMAQASDMVYLVHPVIIGSRIEPSDNRITLFTRTGKYNFPMEKFPDGRHKAMERLDKWNVVDAFHQQKYRGIDGIEEDYTAAGDKAYEKFSKLSVDNERVINFPIAPSADTQVLFQQGAGIWGVENETRFKFTVRGNIYRLSKVTEDTDVIACKINNNCIIGNLMGLFKDFGSKLGYWAPISDLLTFHDSNNKYFMYIFDGLGRVISAQVLVFLGDEALSIRIASVQVNTLSATRTPYYNVTESNRKRHLNNRLTRDLMREDMMNKEQALPYPLNHTQAYEEKFKYILLDAVSPVYDFSGNSSQQDRVPMCISSGIKFFDKSQGQKAVRCSGVDLEFDLEDQDAHLNALSISQLGGKRYVYMSVERASGNVIAMCELSSLRRDAIKRESQRTETMIKLSQCKDKYDIYTPPSDILAFSGKDPGSTNGTCRKIVFFYENLYVLYDIGESLNSQRRPIYNSKFRFFIRSAFAVKNKMYFLTHSNTLVVVEAEFEQGCQGLKFKYIEDMIAHDYFLKQFGAVNWIGEPSMIEYREIEGDFPNATVKPALGALAPAIDPNSISVPKQETQGSKTGLIVIGLVLGGLIVAGLVYMFCLRGDSATLSRKSRRSAGKSKRRSPIPSNESLGVKTLRSSLPSKTTPSATQADPQVQPIQPSQQHQKPNQQQQQPTQLQLPNQQQQLAVPASQAISNMLAPGSKAVSSPLKDAHGASKASGAKTPSSPVKSSAAIVRAGGPSQVQSPIALSVKSVKTPAAAISSPTKSPVLESPAKRSPKSPGKSKSASVSPRSPSKSASPKSPDTPASKTIAASKASSSPKSPKSKAASKMSLGARKSSASPRKSPK